MRNYSSRLLNNTQNLSCVAAETNEGISNISKVINDVVKGASEQADHTSTAVNRIQELISAMDMCYIFNGSKTIQNRKV